MMTINYQLNKEDYLALQLYVGSKSTSIHKKRRLAKWLPFFIFSLGVILFAFYQSYWFAGVMVVLCLIWLWDYPRYERKYYIKSYKKFNDENYKDAEPKFYEMNIDDSGVHTKSEHTESKVSVLDLVSVEEIPNYIFIKIKTGQFFIIPKYDLKNYNNLIQYLKDKTSKWNIPYNEENNWKWR